MAIVIGFALALIACFLVAPAIIISGNISHYEEDQEFERAMNERNIK